MKIFKLKKVSYKNIMSVGDQPIVVQLDAAHKTLITGKNGGGKSTMLEAITFALFGKPFRDIKKGQLINSVNKKNMWVELVLEYNGNEYTVRRGQKPTVFEVLKDGVALDAAAAVKDFQTEFEEMIGMNYNSYKQVVVLGTAGYTPFMGLTTPNRRKLVEDLLEVNLLAVMDKSNKDMIKALNVRLNEVELQMRHNRTQSKTLQDADARQAKLSGDNLGRLEAMKEEQMQKLDGLKAGTKVLNELIVAAVLPEDTREATTAKHRQVVETEMAMVPKDRVISLYLKGGNCPTCTQKLENPELLAHVKDDYRQLSEQFEILKAEHAELHKTKVAYLEAVELVQSYEREIANNKANGQQVVAQIQKINSLIDQAKAEYQTNDEQIAQLETQMNDMLKLKSDLMVERHRRMAIVEMLKDSGIKGTIFKKYLPLFNRQINHYLQMLEADYSFTLNEEFTETIRSRGREDFSYASFSQGEKGRIDLALMFTWRDIAEQISGIKISCLFLDEVFDGAFDASATKSVTSILNSMGDSNIFIISHRDHNPQDYGQHLQMKKVGRFTIME